MQDKFPQIADKVNEATAWVYGIVLTELLSQTRRQPVAEARQIAMYILRIHYGVSTADIAQYYGRKEALVCYSVRTIKGLLKVDKHTRRMCDEIINYCKEPQVEL